MTQRILLYILIAKLPWKQMICGFHVCVFSSISIKFILQVKKRKVLCKWIYIPLHLICSSLRTGPSISLCLILFRNLGKHKVLSSPLSDIGRFWAHKIPLVPCLSISANIQQIYIKRLIKLFIGTCYLAHFSIRVERSKTALLTDMFSVKRNLYWNSELTFLCNEPPSSLVNLYVCL